VGVWESGDRILLRWHIGLLNVSSGHLTRFEGSIAQCWALEESLYPQQQKCDGSAGRMRFVGFWSQGLTAAKVSQC
jgi:hypothetical protein